MLIIPGRPGKDLCDKHLGITRRDLMRVGGSTMMGMTLGGMLQAKAGGAESSAGGPGWNKANPLSLSTCRGAQAISTCGIPRMMFRTM